MSSSKGVYRACCSGFSDGVRDDKPLAVGFRVYDLGLPGMAILVACCPWGDISIVKFNAALPIEHLLSLSPYIYIYIHR